MKLYGYFRSSAAYRVRIALNLKGLAYEQTAVHLARGEQRQPAFTDMNPAALLPVLEDGDLRIAQSLAIIDYLDETYPKIPLLPTRPADRARARQIALSIACDIHPLNNLRVLTYLKNDLAVSDDQKNAWIRHWIELGFAALETELVRPMKNGRFSLGDSPGLADCCLIPQLFNARRFEVDLRPYPRLLAIEAACSEIDAFEKAKPSSQPDAE